MSSDTQPCQEFCCSRFMNEPKTYANFKPDLKNPIHALLAFDNCSGVSKQEYDTALALGFQLASRCFEADAMVKYIVTMAEGDTYHDSVSSKRLRRGCKAGNREIPLMRKQELDALRNNKSECEKFKKLVNNCPHTWKRAQRMLRYPKAEHLQVTPEMRATAKQILADMVSMVTIHVEDAKDPRCEALADSDESHRPQRFAVGTASKIILPRDQLHRWLKAPSSTLNAFRIAQIVLHELSHALGCALDGVRLEEIFHKNAPLSEAGYELEQALFGGILEVAYFATPKPCPKQRDSNQHRGYPVLYQWPSGVKCNQYMSKGQYQFGVRAPLPPYDTVMRVPKSFIPSLLTEKFWNEEAPKYGSGPLRLPSLPCWISKQVPLGECVIRTMCSINDETNSGWCKERLQELGRRHARDTAEGSLDILASTTMQR